MLDVPAPCTRDDANAIRALAMDAVDRAKSGHPGMPMGMADVATVLWTKFLKFDARKPGWSDRDRHGFSDHSVGLDQRDELHVHRHVHERRGRDRDVSRVKRGRAEGRPRCSDGGVRSRGERTGDGQVHRADGSGVGRDHVLHGDRVTGRSEGLRHGKPAGRHRPDERHELHVHRDGDELGRNWASVRSVDCGRSGRHTGHAHGRVGSRR